MIEGATATNKIDPVRAKALSPYLNLSCPNYLDYIDFKTGKSL